MEKAVAGLVAAIISGPSPEMLSMRILAVLVTVLLGVCGVVLIVLRLVAPLIVATKAPAIDVIPGNDSRTLVVVVHGFGGVSRPGLMMLAKAAFPDAHVIAPLYSSGAFRSFSNISPYDIADVLETSIDSAFRRYRYERIVLIGHSLGGELLRKVYLWGAGQEEDRPAGRRGRHEWVDRVERFVSLASINRGWTIDPAPNNMPWYRRTEYAVGTRFAKLTGTGALIRGVQRGSPFVADSRVQWIRLSRQGTKGAPLVIHLLGTRDDVATPEDVKDAQAAKDFKFKSLAATDHADIATALAQEIGPTGPLTDRARTILECVTLPAEQLSFDEPDKLIENPNIRRIVFILHGIRDYDTWGLDLKRLIDAELGADSDTAVVVPRYGYFPMAPFLLWSDRQEKVRWFMDEYTEAVAQYPLARQFDFIGHSNGTYILASALQRYRTFSVSDVYFAGSVVPQRYPWASLVRQERVHRVRNVVATKDWVVAIFPRLFEQIAEWGGYASDPGALDIGAAGFRGFQDAGEPSSGVRDITFADGAHSIGIDIASEAKRAALVRFGRYGLDPEQDKVFDAAFRNAGRQSTFWDQLSNVSWLAWLVIAALTGLGAFVAGKVRWYAAIVYGAVIILLLNSV